jgi:hypothetical protein
MAVFIFVAVKISVTRGLLSFCCLDETVPKISQKISEQPKISRGQKGGMGQVPKR